MSDNLIPSSKVSSGLGFVFDMVVVRINLPYIKDLDISKIRVDAKFIRNDLKITASRINIDEFKPNSGFEFRERPSVLKENLHKYPLECKVNYDDKVVGSCSFLWPDSFINCLSGDCSRELTNCNEGDITHENGVVGKLQVFTRLQIKCNEFEGMEVLKPKVNLCNQPDTGVIDPNDVLFVVGEDKIGSTICNDIDIIPTSESNSSAYRTRLDLSDFRHINGKTVANTDILNTLDAACCKSKKSRNKTKRMIESLGKGTNQTPNCCENSAKNEVKKYPWEQQTKSIDCLSDGRFASCSSSGIKPRPCCSKYYFSPCQSSKYHNES